MRVQGRDLEYAHPRRPQPRYTAAALGSDLVGAQTRVGDVAVLGQAISGSTAIAPSPFFRTWTDFRAAYVLVGRDRGEWRPAVRVDAFATDQLPRSLGARVREHGNAITFALNWRPRAWLRLTGEALRVSSWRNQREQDGLPARQTDTQIQFAARFNGVSRECSIPIDAVVAIFARENGQGLFFARENGGAEADTAASSDGSGTPPTTPNGGKPKLQIVK